MSADAATTAILESYAPSVVARGRVYATEGRVELVEISSASVRARVVGTESYDVSLKLDEDAPIADCSCPAFDRVGECKHVAALAWSLKRERPEVPLLPALERLRAGAAALGNLPAVFDRVYSASVFLERISLYARRRITDATGQWQPLSDWWRRNASVPSRRATREAIVVAAAEVEAVSIALARWRPPPPPLPGTAYADLYRELARLYTERVEDIERVSITQVLPGPLDDRHPGFDLRHDAATKKLTLVELENDWFRPDTAEHLVVRLPHVPGGPVRVEGGGYAHDPWEAWQLFAFRALLLRLADPTDPALTRVVADLGRPVWECMLAHFEAPAAEPDAREWCFVVVSSYGDEHRLAAFARTVGTKRTSKWRKERFETLFTEPASEVEREIGRVAMCALRERNESAFVLGTPQAHALALLLAKHPRVRFSGTPRANPDGDEPADFVVGEVAMQLAQDESGALSPSFVVGERHLPSDVLTGVSFFRGARRIIDGRVTFYSLIVPAALERWVNAAAHGREPIRFPQESIDRLAASAQPLIEAGVVELPRSALGRHVACEPRVGLRVEWLADGSGAALELLVSVAPGAPLVVPGLGPRIFTYLTNGERVHVERAVAHEPPLAHAAMAQIEAPVSWSFLRGHTEGLEDTLALGDYLDRNPHGFVIEMKVGRPPTVVAMSPAGARLVVRQRGSWLVLDGKIEVEGEELALGDLLEAVRLARRYVRAADGVFLELSSDAIAKLRPVAIATELAPAGPELMLHDAFGATIADVRALFDSVKPVGVDLDALAARFVSRKKPKVPALEAGGKLRDYQKDGVAWMLDLAAWAPGCVLADDMGLGKTIQTASVLKARAALGPALIVAPASVTANWIAELARFMPSLRLHWFNDQKTSEARSAVLSEVGAGDVLVVSYGLLQRASTEFSAKRWATLVVDEAQYLKNIGAQRTDAVRSLERSFTIALTGTPLENHLGELYSIVEVAFPGLLGDEARFRERFRRPIETNRDPARLEALSKLVTPFLLRRTRRAVLEELPPREEIVEHIELAADERRQYLALRTACEEQFAKRKNHETPAQLRIALLAALTRLRQLACDVRLVDPTWEGSTTKLGRAVELVRQVAAEGNATLVFSQFTQFLDRVSAAFVAAGLRVCTLTGETPTAKRKDVVDAFQAGGYDVFCISLLAGGTGLNLTRASYVVHLDPWWNPAAEEQATSRAHRMGQSSPVTVYRLVARGTIEEAVLEMHQSKKELASAILEGKAKATKVTPEDLAALLRFGD